MNIQKTKFNDVFIIEPDEFVDNRGTFVKIYNKELFKKHNLETNFEESFYSTSKKNTIRGMHFQKDPYETAKLVYVLSGTILDVVLSLEDKQYISIELSRKAIYIPPGYAHGFATLSEEATLIYYQSKIFSPDHYAGIRYDSFGMNWPIKNPIISERDLSFK